MAGIEERDMDDRAKAAARWATEESDAERASFPEVVKALTEAGIERYHADLVGAIKTYYTPGGEVETVPCHRSGPCGRDFDAGGVEAAVRAIQKRAIGYGEFCRQIAAAGCVGYFVSMAGKRAVYYGRTGDSHVEGFPGAPAKR
jgi:uncharacterized protein YbcV (DUF1398 family)